MIAHKAGVDSCEKTEADGMEEEGDDEDDDDEDDEDDDGDNNAVASFVVP